MTKPNAASGKLAYACGDGGSMHALRACLSHIHACIAAACSQRKLVGIRAVATVGRMTARLVCARPPAMRRVCRMTTAC